MNKLIGIYKITSPSGKVYVGQSFDVERRKSQYRRLENCVKNQIKLHRSILKYGWNKHLFEIIEQCDIQSLNQRERYWQEYYDVLNPEKGLNCKLTETTDKKQLHGEETVNKISNWQKQYHLSNDNNMKGRKHKDSTKELMSEKAKERYKKSSNPNSKKCFCSETNQIWDSLTECWEEKYKNIYKKSYFINMVNGNDKNKTTILKL
jgi:group I intron endonuclease